jgi:outer membrane protein OmpA-like peptidoglycan-associated protein
MPLIIIVLCLLLGSMTPAIAEEPSRLVSGSLLAPGLMPPGWIADHLQDYTSGRGAYAASCRTDEVVGELQVLSKQLDHEEDLRHTARAQLLYAVVEGHSTAKQRTDIAVNALGPLDNDVTTIDGLLVRLSSLPDCDDATASNPASETTKQPPSPTAASPTPAPTSTANLVAPSPEPPPAVTPPAPPAVADTSAPPLARPEVGGSPSTDGDVFVVRFNDQLTGLTPSSIHTLKTALKALDEGHKIQIAIRGCERGDKLAGGAVCAERTRRLKRILSDDGISRPADLLASLAAPSPPPPTMPIESTATDSSTSPPAKPDLGSPPSADSDIFVVRFDDRLTGLTPTSIHTLKKALKALDEGHKVQIAIEGCETGDGGPGDAGCYERTRRLKRILSDEGVNRPADLITKSR